MSAATDGYPSRIVCLTEEPTEVLYLLGEQHRIVGISGFTVRPPIARREKPKVSAFTQREDRPDPGARTGSRDRLLRYPGRDRPATWSAQGSRSGQQPPQCRRHPRLRPPARRDGRRGARAEACGRGLPRRDIAASRCRGNLLASAAAGLLRGMGRAVDQRRSAGSAELIGDRRRRRRLPGTRDAAAGDATASSPIRAEPCGARRTSSSARGAARSSGRAGRGAAGWDAIPAVRDGALHEIKSPLILQPGPAALTDGLDALHRLVRWRVDA